MKHLTLTLVFCIFSFFGISQNLEIIEPQKKVYAEQIGIDQYAVVIDYSNSRQTGEFIMVDDKLLRHGTWKLSINKKKTMKGIFNRGDLVSLTVYEDGTKNTYTKRDIEFFRLNRRIYRLENMISVQY